MGEQVRQGQAVRQQSKHELAAAVQRRYLRASRQEKGRILDELVAATGYHRKQAIRLLRQGPPPARQGHGGRPRIASAVVVGALRQCAEASGWLCGKRLAPFLAELVPALEAEGVLRLDAAVRPVLLTLSAATIDRRLRPFRLARQPHAASAPPSPAVSSSSRCRCRPPRRGTNSAWASSRSTWWRTAG